MSALLSYSLPFPPLSWYLHIQQQGINQVLLDVQMRFEKMSYRNRYYVTGAQGIQLLTIPLEKGRNQRIPMVDVKIDRHAPWQKLHWRTLETLYKRTPYFEYTAPYFEHLFQKSFLFLHDFNVATIQTVQTVLQQKNTIESLNDISVIDDFSVMSDIRTSLKSRQTVAGLVVPEYYQPFTSRCGFQPDMSILDYIFNEGIRLPVRQLGE